MASTQVPPTTYRAYHRTSGPLPQSIELHTEPLPHQLSPHEVLIRVKAVSLNYRDVAMLNGHYPTDHENAGRPCSDCAGEVAAIGGAVKDFKVGDRASTLACAGVTAWTALRRPKEIEPDTAVLLQGTGGVSMFALLICIAANITPIISSSSDTKLSSISALSPLIKGFNYKTQPDQAAQVKQLTTGKGVDIVINNTGAASLLADLGSLRNRHGIVSLVGMLDGQKAEWDPNALMLVMKKLARIQ
ncbi:hypothetical protein SLS60_003960 [Paraconiothyrium brasiliense]|uniref:Enoyl reductase (ER) domain-containing protein n=1 Tax=Paraconiothyrium brasiliense TaxID=300254 RepID=A0ABR3RQ54_9PLEO